MGTCRLKNRDEGSLLEKVIKYASVGAKSGYVGDKRNSDKGVYDRRKEWR